MKKILVALLEDIDTLCNRRIDELPMWTCGATLRMKMFRGCTIIRDPLL